MNQVVVLKNHFIATGEKNGKPWKRHDLKDAGGNRYQTFDEALGNLAAGLVDAPVEIEYEIEDRGQYQNNVIKSIKAANGNGATFQPTGDLSVNPPIEDPRRSKEEMRRTEAAKVAATLLAAAPEAQQTPQEVARVADLIVLYFEQGASAFGSASE